MERYSASQALRLLPLLRSIVQEIKNLREERQETAILIEELEQASSLSPEGFSEAIFDARNRLAEIAESLRRCIHELFRLGVYMQNTRPFVIHIPGISRGKKVVFRWSESSREIEVLSPVKNSVVEADSGHPGA